MADIVNSFKIGSRCVVSQDADLRGNITLGAGCVIHPRSTLLAMVGPIVIGDKCIIEENVVIVNRTKEPMMIGNSNLFQVGCRVESPAIGDHNIFSTRSRVSMGVSVTHHCLIGPGCLVLPSPFPTSLPSSPPSASPHPPPLTTNEPTPDPMEEDNPTSEAILAAPASMPVPLRTETLAPHTAVYGAESRRRKWSGEGEGQGEAYHQKQLAFQQEIMPRFLKLKMF